MFPSSLIPSFAFRHWKGDSIAMRQTSCGPSIRDFLQYRGCDILLSALIEDAGCGTAKPRQGLLPARPREARHLRAAVIADRRPQIYPLHYPVKQRLGGRIASSAGRCDL